MARPAALGGALALALAAWLLLPVHGAGPARPMHVVLLDESDSVRRTRPEWERWARAAVSDELRVARETGAEPLVVRYAAEVVLAGGDAAAAERGADLRGDRSDLHGALSLLETWAARRGGATGRARILSDGGYTGADPRPLLQRLGVAGLGFELVAPPTPARPDLAVTRVSLPAAVEPGAPVAAEVHLRLAPWTSAPAERTCRLLVDVTDATGERVLVLERNVPVSDRPWWTRVELGPAASGRSVVSVWAQIDGDPVPENDRSTAAFHAGDDLVLALVASDEARRDADRWLGSPGRLAGIQVLRLAPDDLAQALPEVDALVSVDLGEADLAGTGLASFVRRGGGWLACGGPRLFRAPEGDLLPLRPAPEDGPTREVVLLLDGSGSMAGAPFEAVRAAALDALQLARSNDRFVLRLFTDALADEHVLGAGGEGTERAARVLLEARLPRGPTDVHAVLEELAAEREARAGPALVLLLSDGRDQPTDESASARGAAVRARLAAADARLVVIAMGERADLAFLRSLVAPGEAVLEPTAPAALVELFRDEVAGDRVHRRAPIEVRSAEPASLPWAEAAEWLTALDAGAAAGYPALESMHRAVPRSDEVAVLWRGADRDPLLAVARVGAGRVAAWASAPVAGWGSAWSGRPELVAPLLRALGRTAASRPRGRRARLADGVLRVEGVVDWPALVDARLRPAEGAGAGLALTLAVPADGGGEDPRGVREGTLSGGVPWTGGAVLEAAGEEWVLAAPPSPEFAARDLQPSERPTLPGVRGAPGGGGSAGSGAGAHPLALWPLIAGLWLCVAAAFLGWERAAPGHQGIRATGR
jgi:hypothetical protein